VVGGGGGGGGVLVCFGLDWCIARRLNGNRKSTPAQQWQQQQQQQQQQLNKILKARAIQNPASCQK